MAGLVCARPPVPRPRRRGVAGLIAVLAVLACGGMFTCAPAVGQPAIFSFPPAPPPPPKSAIAVEREKAGNQQQMLVKANEIDYDYANHRVSAVGNVQIYLSQFDARSRQGDLRPDDQAPARRRQCSAYRSGRQGHLWHHHGPVGRLSRRVRQFAAFGHPRSDAHGGRPRRAHQWKHHRLPQRRLHRLLALQGRSEEAAAVAGESRAHHPRPGREDDLFRGRAPRILRPANRLDALLLGARSDRQTQDRRADAVDNVEHHLRTGA